MAVKRFTPGRRRPPTKPDLLSGPYAEEKRKRYYGKLVGSLGIREKRGSIGFTVGVDSKERLVQADFNAFRHLAIGGTGYADEPILQSMTVELAAKYSPQKLQLLLIDGAGETFSMFGRLPHLISGGVVTEIPLALGALDWAIGEMERRFELFNAKIQTGARIWNVDDYNDACAENEEKLAKILIVVGELRALMSEDCRGTERRLQELMQMGHAAGIHVVVATGFVSPDVLKGTIRVRCGAKIAFRLFDERASRVILEEGGAETLDERGELLFVCNGWAEPMRARVTKLTSAELEEYVLDAVERYAVNPNYINVKFILE